MDWFGNADINFTHAASPRPMKERDGRATDLLQIVEESTPPCHLNPLLFNGHIQTCWTATKPSGPSIYYKRKLFEADHDTYRGSYAVDFVVPPHDGDDPSLPHRTVYFDDEELQRLNSDDSKPMLVVLHGLSGGSHEIYLRHAIAPLAGDGGWDVCVINSRGCAKSKITSGVLYNARATWDLRQTVKWLTEKYPNRPLFGLGFSLGANMLTNYCGEEGSKCLLKGAVACGNPFNLEISSKILRNSYFGREVYLRVMADGLKELVRSHRDVLEKYSKVDLERVLDVTYLHEFDREIQCPTWGYPTENAYYRDASSSDAILSIKIPFLAVSATDDPIAVKEALPYEEFQQNPNTILLTTSLGGHLCWFETGGSRWYPRPIMNFLNHLVHKTDPDSLKPQAESEADTIVLDGLGYAPMRRKMAISGQ